MTLAEIKNQIMLQTNNYEDDIDDYLPHLVDYINDGYDRLVKVWTHRAICDWATWLVYRNGNPQKQNRGMAFRYAFEEILAKLSDEGGLAGLNEDGTNIQYKNFRNIPV